MFAGTFLGPRQVLEDNTVGGMGKPILGNQTAGHDPGLLCEAGRSHPLGSSLHFCEKGQLVSMPSGSQSLEFHLGLKVPPPECLHPRPSGIKSHPHPQSKRPLLVWSCPWLDSFSLLPILPSTRSCPARRASTWSALKWQLAG